MLLDTLTREERLYGVFAAYGRAMLTAHGLELRLTTLLSIRIVLDGGAENEQRRALAKIEQQPMGGLVRDFIAIFEPSEDVMEELGNMLYFRNELSHRISKMMLLSASKGDWEAPLILKLEEMSQMFIDTERLLEPFMVEYRSKIGVPEETIEELGRRFYPGAVNVA